MSYIAPKGHYIGPHKNYINGEIANDPDPLARRTRRARMNYLVADEPLEWFSGPATATVRSAGFSIVGPAPESLDTPELLEMLANCMYSESGDFEYTTRAIFSLARRLGIGEADINLSIADNFEIWNGHSEVAPL